MYMVVGMEHQALRLLWIAYGLGGRVEIVSRYSTWELGKRNTENMIRHLEGHGFNARRLKMYDEPFSDTVEISVRVETDDYDAVVHALETPLL